MSTKAQFISEFANALTRITEACNQYVSNQIPDNAEYVNRQARQVIEDYSLSQNEHIIQVLAELKAALDKNRTQNANTEGDLVSDIRTVVDIVEAKNLVLTPITNSQ